MAKTGRNEPCPCGSGVKYKKCCLEKTTPAENLVPTTTQQSFVLDGVASLQQDASNMKKSFRQAGAFVFFSTDKGDAWLLELTEQDALYVARKGEKLIVEIDESDDDLSISWSHSFEMKGGKLTTTSYLGDSVEVHGSSYPLSQIELALENISAI